MRTITAEDILDHALTENEKGWLRQRDKGHWVDENERLFGRPVEDGSDDREVGVGPSSASTEKTDEPTDNYDSWKIKELKEEGEGRTPAVDFTGCSKKEDYVLALRSWDLEHPDNEE